jgi:beta-glucosidase
MALAFPSLLVILKDCHKENASFNREEHHALARQAGGESIVLLKSADSIVPLNLEKLKKIAVIGAFAKAPRYQGSGSSQVNPTKVSNAYDELAKMADGDGKFAYAAGYGFRR